MVRDLAAAEALREMDVDLVRAALRAGMPVPRARGLGRYFAPLARSFSAAGPRASKGRWR